MTDLEEPQFADWIPALLPGHRARHFGFFALAVGPRRVNRAAWASCDGNYDDGMFYGRPLPALIPKRAQKSPLTAVQAISPNIAVPGAIKSNLGCPAT